jgi:hypothetical protein
LLNDWYYSPEHGELCRVIETQTLWGETVCRVWLPGKDTVVRLPAARLRPVHEASVGTVDGIAYLTAAARKIPENVIQEDPKLLMWYDQALTRSGEE